jgi:5-methylcytosine-specific restriction protein A
LRSTKSSTSIVERSDLDSTRGGGETYISPDRARSDVNKHSPPCFTVGGIYSKTLLHKKYGGNPQRGISPSGRYDLIFLFTGPRGKKYGYADCWEGGVFHYFGEGKHRDMTLDYGNKAVIEHIERHKDLHLFKQLAVDTVQYIGQMVYLDHEIRKQDSNKVARVSIVFHLAPYEAIRAPNEKEEFTYSEDGAVDLKRKAYLSASASPTLIRATVELKARSRHIKEYALSRAKGTCEYCQEKAPFLDVWGYGFLEVHHILSLSDGGPDDPQYVATLCPNCHRRAHYGRDANEVNSRLLERVKELERC